MNGNINYVLFSRTGRMKIIVIVCPCFRIGQMEILIVCSCTRISLGVMINEGMLLASSRRLIFCGPMIVLGLTGKSSYAVK